MGQQWGATPSIYSNKMREKATSHPSSAARAGIYHLLTARCASRTLRDEMSSAAILRPAKSRSEACVRSGVEERPTWEAEFGCELEVRSKHRLSGAVAGVQAMEQPLVFASRLYSPAKIIVSKLKRKFRRKKKKKPNYERLAYLQHKYLPSPPEVRK